MFSEDHKRRLPKRFSEVHKRRLYKPCPTRSVIPQDDHPTYKEWFWLVELCPEELLTSDPAYRWLVANWHFNAALTLLHTTERERALARLVASALYDYCREQPPVASTRRRREQAKRKIIDLLVWMRSDLEWDADTRAVHDALFAFKPRWSVLRGGKTARQHRLVRLLGRGLAGHASTQVVCELVAIVEPDVNESTVRRALKRLF